MPELKKWKIGCADEPWKMEICEHEIRKTDSMLQQLDYILISDGMAPKTSQEVIDRLGRLTCKEILNGICAYRNSNAQSIQNGGAAKLNDEKAEV